MQVESKSEWKAYIEGANRARFSCVLFKRYIVRTQVEFTMEIICSFMNPPAFSSNELTSSLCSVGSVAQVSKESWVVEDARKKIDAPMDVEGKRC